MEVETFAQQLQHKLAEKNEQSPIYRKASGVLASLMHAARTIPNFNHNYANSSKTMSLYITAGVFRLLRQILEGDQKHQHNLDAYLLLLNMVLPECSQDALIQGGLIQMLRQSMQDILNRNENTPLMTRLAISILSHSLAPGMANTNFKDGQDRKLLLSLFQRAVASPRSNAMSRECSRLLVHLLKNNASVSGVIAQQSKTSLLNNLDEKKEQYLANVKEVMVELPVRLLNDICHRLASNLAEIDATDPSQEHYLAQTYFFLEKMCSKLLSSTLQDLLLILINAVPTATQHERVQLSYLQLLYEATLALTQANQKAANKILSPIFAVLIQLLIVGPKIGKFAGNLLTFLINNCISPSLWRKKQQQISLQSIGLYQSGRDFSKIVCLFQSLLSSRFSNRKLTVTLLAEFISKLEEDAIGQCSGLIQKIIDYRGELQERGFKKVMESILVTFGVENILTLYPIGLNGDIASPKFEDQNNLWILTCFQKTERSESMVVFYRHIFPLIQLARQYQQNEGLSKQRRQGYQLIQDLMWRCIKVFSKVVSQTVNYQEVLSIIENQIKRVNDSTLQQLSFALELLSDILFPLKYRSQASEQIIKTLANVLDINNGSARQVLNAIKGLARIAPPEYVKRVFDKNIQKLISLSEQNSLTKDQHKNLKNLQILMSVNSSIDLQDPSVTTKFRISRQELLLRLVNNLLTLGGPFQKKGYKYLGETLSAAPRSLFLEVLQLLEGHFKVENGSKHHRLGVIGKLWSWLKAGGFEQNLQKIIAFIKNHLPQILLSVRQSNKGARNEGIRILAEFTDTMQEVGLFENFVESVCAGLVGERSEMKLATLSGLGIVIGKGYCSEQIFKEVLQIVLLLLKQKRQELYRGVVEFCRRGIISRPVDKQKVYLPIVLQFLFEEDEEGKMEHRSMLRHFLLKLTKKHGKELLEQMIPQQHRKMLAHALKMQNREKKKKRQQNIARRKYYQQQQLQKKTQQQLQSSESQSEHEEVRQVRNNEMDIEEGGLEELDNTNNLLLKYDLEKQQFHFQRDQLHKVETVKKMERNEDEITFDDKGIMIIQERKRQRISNEDEEPEEEPANNTTLLNFKKKPKTEIHQVKQSGQAYRSTRAGGDLKLKDKPQPYAFIQFSSKALNKRFKKRAQHVFQNLFEKKEGGLKGLKSRIINGN